MAMMQLRFHLTPVAESLAPVYIYTIRPENFQRRRLETLTEGVTTQAEVRSLFGRPAVQSRVSGYEVWFYQIPVYNPFEVFPGRN